LAQFDAGEASAKSADRRSPLEYVSEKEVVDLLARLVGFPSHEGVPERETAVASYIRDFFLDEGIEAETVPVTDGRCNVVARLRGKGGGKSLLFAGHTDTVPPYDMKRDPYAAEIDRGKMYGRGVVDMKAGLACMMIAMLAIKRSGTELSGDLIFAGLIDEEAKSEGARAYLKTGESPDAAIVGEPTGMRICVGHRGLEWFEFTFHGKTVHGGKQKEGINAIRKAAMFINKLESNLIPSIEARTDPLIGASSMNYGFIKGGTQPSTVAGECVLQIDRRWVPAEKFSDIRAEYQGVLDGLRAEDPTFDADFKVMDISYMEDRYIHEAMRTDPNDRIVRVAQNAIEEALGESGNPTSFPAWSDGGLLNYYGKIPTIILGPGDLAGAHSSDEYIEIAALFPAVSVYCGIACEYCG
jgi:acetylornithine deacetylase/succinyl-diaminopimelate desuccinylase